jgi:hypothetical protein
MLFKEIVASDQHAQLRCSPEGSEETGYESCFLVHPTVMHQVQQCTEPWTDGKTESLLQSFCCSPHSFPFFSVNATHCCQSHWNKRLCKLSLSLFLSTFNPLFSSLLCRLSCPLSVSILSPCTSKTPPATKSLVWSFFALSNSLVFFPPLELGFAVNCLDPSLEKCFPARRGVSFSTKNSTT